MRARPQRRHAHGARRIGERRRLPLRRQGAEQPERRLRQLGRRRLVHRPAPLGPDGRLGDRAGRRARFPRRLPDHARSGRARAAHRRARLPERPVPLPRRAPALRERLVAHADPRLRRHARRHVENNRLLLTEPGPRNLPGRHPRRHEVRRDRQPLLHRAGRRLGHLTRGRAPRHDRDPRTSLQHGLRRAGLVDALRHRDSLRLPRATASARSAPLPHAP